MTPEANLKAKIRYWIISIGGYVFCPVQMGMGIAGLDMYVCLNGKFIAIEAKAPGKYKDPVKGCTPRQKTSMAAVQLAGGIAFATDSLEHVQEVLGRVMRG